MADRVGTNGQLWRRMAIAMAISVPISVAATYLAMVCIFGSDPDATIPVPLAFKFGLTMAVIGPVLLGPLASYRTHLAIRERDRAQIELRRIAETDQLTGLRNRRGFDAAATAAFVADDAIRPVSVLMLDVDFFKSINDRFGHDFGDAALVRVATVLRDAATARGFIVGRQGGEEFVVLLPDADATAAIVVAEQLRNAIAAAPIAYGNHSASIAVSIGVASRRQGTASLSELVSQADSALYSAKASGRNRVVHYRPGDDGIRRRVADDRPRRGVTADC